MTSLGKAEPELQRSRAMVGKGSQRRLEGLKSGRAKPRHCCASGWDGGCLSRRFKYRRHDRLSMKACHRRFSKLLSGRLQRSRQLFTVFERSNNRRSPLDPIQRITTIVRIFWDTIGRGSYRWTHSHIMANPGFLLSRNDQDTLGKSIYIHPRRRSPRVQSRSH